MTTIRLSQAVAVDKGVKNQTKSAIEQAYHVCQKPALFDGFDKKYTPKAEDGDVYPPQSQRVQNGADELIRQARKAWNQLFDISATKDFGNTVAKADVVVDGATILVGAPVTYLLFLEKQLDNVRTFIRKLPVLDPARNWVKDSNDKLFKTKATQTIKTKKVPRALVKHEGNEHHPPQTEVVAEDIIEGMWNEIKFSGAMPEARQQELLERVEKFQQAVKSAREEANATEVERKRVSEDILGYLFN